MINVAEILVGTRALGPGVRTVIWVQGCPFHCPDCYSPAWIPDKPAQPFTPEDLFSISVSDHRIQGITLSGGEPFFQSEELGKFLRLIREQTTLNVICFSGFTFRQLTQHPSKSVQSMLRMIDVLIDGAYIREKNTNLGLRGSTNQKIYHLTSSLIHFDFVNIPRVNEIQISNNTILATGIPTHGIKSLLVRRQPWLIQSEERNYERT
ncbi:MAG: radical SAM protein [Patescibacteria group bacterium]|nr:radical SAM protein [Patescibacteria group bacterium]